MGMKNVRPVLFNDLATEGHLLGWGGVLPIAVKRAGRT